MERSRIKDYFKSLLLVSIILLTCSSRLFSQQEARLEANDFFSKDAPSKVALALSPDGKYLAKTFSRTSFLNMGKGTAYAIQLFDAKTLQPVKQLINPEVVDQIMFTPDSKFLVGKYNEAAWKAAACIWNVGTGEMKVIKLEYYPMNIDISPDGRSLLVGGRYTCIYDLTTFQVTLRFKSDSYSSANYLEGGKYIITRSENKIQLWDAGSGSLIDERNHNSLISWRVAVTQVSPDGKLFSIPLKNTTDIYRVDNGRLIPLFTLNAFSRGCIFDQSEKSIFLINNSSIIRYNLINGLPISTLRILPPPKGRDENSATDNQNGCLMNIVSVNHGQHLLITDYQSVSSIYSVKKNRVEAIFYTNGDKDYAFITPDGRMEGTTAALDNLHWVIGNKTVPLVNTYDQMYTPHLLSQIFADNLEQNEVNLDAMVKLAPEIRITSPQPEFKTSSPSVSIKYELKENGDEIKQVRIYVNDKLVSDETRGMKYLNNESSYNINLLPGVNSIKAIAISKNGYQSMASEMNVIYSGSTARSKMYIMAIGIDKYKNPMYNLNYAVADATAAGEQIRASAQTIFDAINIYYFNNESARRDSIIQGFNKIAALAQPQDAFVLYYAGHGVMSDGTPEIPKDFYLVLQDITQLYGNDDMLKDRGISAAELRELSKKISAQKQVVFLDSCQSGAAVETYAMRGVAEEKAILQLARSTGSYLIASTGSEQYATEFKELGHGVFTYAILQGLNCNAYGVQNSKKITIKELEVYLNDNIPILTEKYHGTVQYPRSWSKGMDFPIAVCK